MPSAANAKIEKPPSSEVIENFAVRQIITIIEHKIRNLEKRKSKLTSYRDLQKAGKELNSDQKVAVAKYDEVSHTLDFIRDLAKQIGAVATAAERDAKKQAKKDARVRNAADTNKIREVLLVLDCLMQMGQTEVREDFINGTNGAAKLTDEDLRILDDLYPEVTPKHELNEEGQPSFHIQTVKAADHLCSIIDGKPKEVLGTTYTHIKEIVSAVHGCAYFDRAADAVAPEEPECAPAGEEEIPEPTEAEAVEEEVAAYPPPAVLPVAPAPAAVPAPVYPLRSLPPITLQEVEHAYFAQQYPQQRPIAEVIGSQNFFFLQESEIDSPVGTPQPPPIVNRHSPPAPIPTQTFTNQHFVRGPPPMPPQPHFPPHAECGAFPPAPLPLPTAHAPPLPPLAAPAHLPLPTAPQAPQPTAALAPQPAVAPPQSDDMWPAGEPPEDRVDDDWKESRNSDRDEAGERKVQGHGDGHNRYRRYGRGSRGAPNGHRGRGFQARQGGDGYRGRHSGEYQNRGNRDGHQRHYEGYQSRHGKDSYQNRSGDDGYYGNGDASDNHQSENGGRDRYEGQSYQGGFKGRGRGGPRPPRGAGRPPRAHHYSRKPDNAE